MVVREVASKDGQILFLGKSPKKVAKIMKKNNPYEKIIQNAAIQCSQPYLTGQTKWINGSFTNWEEMIRQFSRKVEKTNIQDLKKKGGKASVSKDTRGAHLVGTQISEYRPGMLEWVSDLPQREGVTQTSITEAKAGYSTSFSSPAGQKKTADFEGKLDSTLSFGSEIKNLNSSSSGAQQDWSWLNLHKVSGNKVSRPDLIFAIGISELGQPLKEAHQAGIPIIAVVDSNQNPFLKNQSIDYIIPGNDDSIRSYAFFCMMICKAVQEGRLLIK